MRIASTIGATSCSHDGTVYEPDEDGTFEVPELVGEELLGFAEWIRDWEALDLQLAQDLEDARDPEKVAERLTALEDAQRVAAEKDTALAAKDEEIAKLRAELAAATAPAPTAEPETSAEPEKAPAAKKAPAKKTAAPKTQPTA